VTLPLELAQPRVIRLDLPTPPSNNRYWRNLLLPGRGRKTKSNPTGLAAVTVTSVEARVYVQNVKVEFHRQLGYDIPPFTGPVRLSIVWRRERRAGDLSNRIKVVEDALRGLAYVDDSQVVSLSAERVDGERPGVTVRVEELA